MGVMEVESATNAGFTISGKPWFLSDNQRPDLIKVI